MKQADFTGADLIHAIFGRADLVGADFSGALMADANFFKANIFGVDLTVAEKKSPGERKRYGLRGARRSGAKQKKTGE